MIHVHHPYHVHKLKIIIKSRYSNLPFVTHLQDEHDAVLSSIEKVREDSKQTELQLLNSSEEKISKIKSEFEAEIQKLTDAKEKLEIELESSKAKFKQELNKTTEDKQKIKTAVDEVISKG